ncbi:hypothetical protein WUBG_11108, partial [Wuchereria bancrofti]
KKSQTEEKLPTLSSHLEVIQAADNSSETVVDDCSNQISVANDHTAFKASNSGSSKFTRF